MRKLQPMDFQVFLLEIRVYWAIGFWKMVLWAIPAHFVQENSKVIPQVVSPTCTVHTELGRIEVETQQCSNGGLKAAWFKHCMGDPEGVVNREIRALDLQNRPAGDREARVAALLIDPQVEENLLRSQRVLLAGRTEPTTCQRTPLVIDLTGEPEVEQVERAHRHHLGEREFLEQRALEARRRAREAAQEEQRQQRLAERHARAAAAAEAAHIDRQEADRRALKRRRESVPTRST